MALSNGSLDPKNTWLLVIDVQNDYCHDRGSFGQSGFPLRDIQTMVPRLASFIGEARQAGVRVVFIRTEHGEWTNSPIWVTRRARRAGPKAPPICVEGSWGAEFYQVEPVPADRVVTKHRYSAFIDTELDLILRSHRAAHLLFTGVATNVCVESTLRDAFMKDYLVTLVEDCCAATTPEEHRGTIVNVSKYFGDVRSSRDVLAALRGEVVEA